MTRKGPLITLLAGGALAAGLLIANVGTTGGDDREPVAAAGTPTPTASPEAVPTTPPPVEQPDPVTYVGYVDGGGASVAIIIPGVSVIPALLAYFLLGYLLPETDEY